jgi:AraC-like DNA-binding protein
MPENPGGSHDCRAPQVPPEAHSPATRAALARTLRDHLADAIDRLGGGTQTLQRPAPASVTRGEGHFHLRPELFLQLGGHTDFHLPHGMQRLMAGEALLMPPRLLHHEVIAAGGDGQPFRNLVVYSDGEVLTCHLAHEHAPGQPGILYLEARRHPQAARLLAWLSAAAEVGEAPQALPDRQAGALVAAALAGLRHALDAPADRHAPAEPALIARLRVLVKDQLGDATLSVRGLAAQCGCSADHLSHVFRRHTGEALAAHLNRLRIERAVQLLDETTLSGKEIAWACGFAGPSYFIQQFRHHCGMTPRQWRERAGPGPVAQNEALRPATLPYPP